MARRHSCQECVQVLFPNHPRSPETCMCRGQQLLFNQTQCGRAADVEYACRFVQEQLLTGASRFLAINGNAMSVSLRANATLRPRMTMGGTLTQAIEQAGNRGV